MGFHEADTNNLIVFLAPEKLMQSNSPFHQLLKAGGASNYQKIAFMVIDEAHIVEDW